MKQEKETLKAWDLPKEVLNLFDQFVHGDIDRRGFLEQASKYAVGGLTAAAMLDFLSPNYALAQQVKENDERIQTEWITVNSPDGYGTVRCYTARPKVRAIRTTLPAVLVIHENRGLNPYIADVVRRFAAANFIALAPDGLTSLGGYPGNDEAGTTMQAKLDPNKMLQDFIAGARHLREDNSTNGKVGVVGFCFGGGMANQVAVWVPWLQAAAPFYGPQPKADEAVRIQAPLLLHYAGMDDRINMGWPAYEATLKQWKKKYTMYQYPNTMHGFHNDTTPRYDAAAAKLAWDRTITFFNENLKTT